MADKMAAAYHFASIRCCGHSNLVIFLSVDLWQIPLVLKKLTNSLTFSSFSDRKPDLFLLNTFLVFNLSMSSLYDACYFFT